MPKAIIFAALCIVAAAFPAVTNATKLEGKLREVEWCVYPYANYDKEVRRNGFILTETGSSNRGFNWWSPLAKWDHDKGYYVGAKAWVHVDRDYNIHRLRVKASLKIDDDSRDYDKYSHLISELYLDSSEPIQNDKCFCSSEGNSNYPRGFQRNGNCPDVWEKGNPWNPLPEYKNIFNPRSADVNCPKCERGLCEEGEPYESWTYFEKTEGYVNHLKDIGKCEIYSGTGPVAQIGTKGANSKNEYFGYALWLRCDDKGYEKEYDLEFNVGPCCHKCSEYAFKWIPTDNEDLKAKFEYTLNGGDFSQYPGSYSKKYLQENANLRSVVKNKLGNTD